MARKRFTEDEVRSIIFHCTEGCATVFDVILPEPDGNLIHVTMNGELTVRELTAISRKFNDDGLCVSGNSYERLDLIINPMISY